VPATSATDEVAPGIVSIDTMMAGRATVTSAYLVLGDRPALVETGPTTSSRAVLDGLDRLGLGAEDLAHVALTHIHLDHAGGVARVAAAYPKATVWVHHRGAPHLANPAKLVASAARLYGEERLRALFGPVDPVPEARIRVADDGRSIDLGGRRLEVLETTGHASHHVALADSSTGAVFAGDALGIHLPDVGVLRPATPPPDVDVERAIQSIETIRERAAILLFSHFGPVAEVDELCSAAASRLQTWAGIVRDAMRETEDLDRIADILDARTGSDWDQAAPDTDGRERYEILSDARMNAAGLVRYWRRREEREGGTGVPAGGGSPLP
jgi:glyoxylase-like metal-dependent hydrolase (beta-lactamase superfamily II)